MVSALTHDTKCYHMLQCYHSRVRPRRGTSHSSHALPWWQTTPLYHGGISVTVYCGANPEIRLITPQTVSFMPKTRMHEIQVMPKELHLSKHLTKYQQLFSIMISSRQKKNNYHNPVKTILEIISYQLHSICIHKFLKSNSKSFF